LFSIGNDGTVEAVQSVIDGGSTSEFVIWLRAFKKNGIINSVTYELLFSKEWGTMKPTIYDVAREAGVSIATVSKVLNNTGRIGEDTRKKVMKVMNELNYQPSVVASALTGKSTYTIGLLIPDLANPFFAEIARHIEDFSQLNGYSVMMCSTDYDPEKEAKYISLLRQKSVDGIILASRFKNKEVLKDLINHHFPLALIDLNLPEFPLDSVEIDHFQGGYLVTHHLLSLGHRTIGVIAEESRSSQERIRGYRQALEEAGLAFEESYVLTTDFTVEGSKNGALKLFALKNRPTAILACNDLLAIGVTQALRELGLSIPAEVSVTGFDNTILASATNPPLTTVDQPKLEMGRQVVELLIKNIEGKAGSKQRIILLPEIVVRQSSSAPKG
jgi:DNA-binding LacI/PurR family transcriptional regulator